MKLKTRIAVFVSSLAVMLGFTVAPAQADYYEQRPRVRCFSLILPTFCWHDMVVRVVHGGPDNKKAKRIVFKIDEAHRLDRSPAVTVRFRVYDGPPGDGRKIYDNQWEIDSTARERRRGTIREVFPFSKRGDRFRSGHATMRANIRVHRGPDAGTPDAYTESNFDWTVN